MMSCFCSRRNSSAPVSRPELRRSSSAFPRSTSNVVHASYNIILIRIPPQPVGAEITNAGVISIGSDVSGEGLFQMFYNDPAGTGLQPLPSSMSESLLGAGLDRVLDRLIRLESINPDENNNNNPASKPAILSMKMVEIKPSHISAELNCAVCHEEFVIRSGARELPCKHLYHPDCIIPWLLIKKSCPICRLELLPMTQNTDNNGGNVPFGITLWRFSSGAFVLARYTGSNALPWKIVISFPRTERRGGGGGIRRMFGGLVSFCKRVLSSSSSGGSFSSAEAELQVNLILRSSWV